MTIDAGKLLISMIMALVVVLIIGYDIHRKGGPEPLHYKEFTTKGGAHCVLAESSLACDFPKQRK